MKSVFVHAPGLGAPQKDEPEHMLLGLRIYCMEHAGTSRLPSVLTPRNPLPAFDRDTHRRMDVPPGLLESTEALKKTRGAWVVVQAEVASLQGELLAVEPDTLFLIRNDTLQHDKGYLLPDEFHTPVLSTPQLGVIVGHRF